MKRNRWLVGTVLVLAVSAFLALSLLPLLSSGGRRSVAEAPGTGASPNPTDAQAELASRAQGYELVLEREPENQTALRGLIETRLEMGDLEGLLVPLEKLAELNPETPDYAVLLGQTRQQLGDLEGAAQAYRSVLDQQPGNMNALQGLVALLVQQQRPQAAIGLLQDTLSTAEQLEIDGNTNMIDTTSVQLLLAQVYVENQEMDRAIELYDQTIAQDPEDFRPVLAKALVLQGAGQAEAADPLFAQAVSMAPAQFKDEIEQMAAGSTVPNGMDNGASPSNEDIEATEENAVPGAPPSDAESDASEENPATE